MRGIALSLDPAPWKEIHDGVMGGVSSGRMTAAGDHLVFSGELSLENNGGFASVRRAAGPFTAVTGRVRLEVRGDGRRYQFRLRQDTAFDGVAWRAEFVATDEWLTVEWPLTRFEPVFRGRRVPGAGGLQPTAIRQAGFMLADGVPGPFRLEIRAIEFLAGEGRSR